MPRTKTPTTNAEALDRVEAAVTRVLTLVQAVFRKYPRNTIPEALRMFTQRYGPSRAWEQYPALRAPGRERQV